MTSLDVAGRYAEGLGRLEKLVLARDQLLDTLRGEASVSFSTVHHICDIDPVKLRVSLDQIMELEKQIRRAVQDINIYADAAHKKRVLLVARTGVNHESPTTPLRRL